MNPVSRTLALVMTAWSLAVGGLAAQGVTTSALFGTITGSDSTALEDHPLEGAAGCPVYRCVLASRLALGRKMRCLPPRPGSRITASSSTPSL